MPLLPGACVATIWLLCLLWNVYFRGDFFFSVIFVKTVNNDTDSKFFEQTVYTWFNLENSQNVLYSSLNVKSYNLARIFKTLSHILGTWRLTMAQGKAGKLLLFILRMRESWLK